MIPADVASRQQVSADAALRPVAPSQEIADKLPGLVVGQKIMAEIQSLLPNGTYRALINQRSITLALPFSAKSGDALELQVTETDGKLALAVVSRREGDGGKPAADSASTTLSRTGQLISTLFSAARETKGGPPVLTLNANQPISPAPANAQDLLPLLKQAITQSGMFYESHQAEWIEGRFTKAALLQEPQGKLSAPAAFAQANVDEAITGAHQNAPIISSAPATASRPAAEAVQSPSLAIEGAKMNATQSSTPSSAPALEQVVAPPAQHLVQQQLEALATQNFSWQGQIWPGQQMRWEIDQDAARQGQEGEETSNKWSTRVHLNLPNLGEIDARIRLEGQQINLSMSAGKTETRALMRASGMTLRSQLEGAGLALIAMGVEATTESQDGQAGE
ncbi:flagellar hook-length control protein FliK [Propionivibrio sp.]|uniref:flagellar hook-length control protein FliK n=1 Tax=Propionivibrio sp. TaxID=2212460 RepID=UPI0025D919CE|nr:flagellar hook-length control protein FliK [Propionivibrio sp.]MBK7355559.1 flagellar hook-length control protein FliK [Propionivibrio sp.]MBK8400771.1 flagellar hook-length control protein FliK [Propionivibrio sp.]MBK8744797.1 flagellar hook-length control protein FliK [Propionivibrio sp.]MBK8893223.1 flagellar hook-length control protein FliK [Propionivibrio sp.]